MTAGHVAVAGKTDGGQIYQGSYEGNPPTVAASSSSSSYPSSSSSPSTQRSVPNSNSNSRSTIPSNGHQRPAVAYSSERLLPQVGLDSTASGQSSDSDKRRQRIQQACKSCGSKRVKCDGQLPCNTCLRTGEQCEYGRPKKRGPPKGSSRAAPKRFAQEHSQSSMVPQHHESNPYVKASHGDSGSSSRSSSHGHATHRMLVPNASRALTTRLPSSGYDIQSVPLPLSSSASAAPRISSHGASDPRVVRRSSPPSSSFASMMVQRPAPSPRPLPQLPVSSNFAFDRPPRSYGVLPDPTVASQSPSWHSKFRGGSSGILDLPRLVRSDPFRSSGSRYWPDSETHLQRSARRSSPASFALEPAAVSGADSSGSVTGYNIEEDHEATLARNTVQAPSLFEGNTYPHQHPDRKVATIEDFAAEGVFSDATTQSRSSNRRSRLHEPNFPDYIEHRIFSIYWGIVFAHWPMLVKRMLPMIDGQPRVDHEADPLLHNAILSLAACVWDPQRDGPLPAVKMGGDDVPRVPSIEELSEVYFTRARYWLARIDNESSIETAQALLCMSLRENGCGRSTQSAHYAMSACRVALDLGLQRHIPMTDASPDEIQTRLRLWWCIYSLDKLNAAQLGRPCVLRYIETDTPLPEVDHPDEIEVLEPLEDPSSASLAGQPMQAISGLFSSSELTVILEEVLQQYNLVRSRACPIKETNADGFHNHSCIPLEAWDVAVGRLHARLDKWTESLPSCLRIQSGGPTWPHILCQHIWACAIRIILHRPHILRPGSTQTNLPDSHRVCTESALELCRLVALYKKDHGIKRLSGTISYCVFTAASILLANSTSPDKETATVARSCLKECCTDLSLIGGTWGNAGVHLSILRRLGESIDANLEGTGLEVQDGDFSSSTKAALAHLLHPDDHRSDPRGPTQSVPTSRTLSSHDRSTKEDKTAGFPASDPLGNEASLSATEVNTSGHESRSASGVPDDILSALQDEHYWSRMPLSSENVEAWNMFTKSYLEERQAYDS